MTRSLRAIIIAVSVAAAGSLATDSASAQWGYGSYYGGRSYYHAPYAGRSFHFSFGTTPRTSYYAPSYGYGSAYAPYAYGSAYSYGPTYGAPHGVYGRPRGELSYDVYTPFGRQEVNYRFRRDGRVRVDIDD